MNLSSPPTLSNIFQLLFSEHINNLFIPLKSLQFCIHIIEMFLCFQISRAMRCPSLKFATHVISHFLFLILLSAATFRLEEKNDFIKSTDNLLTVPASQYADKAEILMKEKLRPANTVITHVQICIVLWVVGTLC